MRMSKRMQLLVKRIQYWLRKHEYQSGYSGLMLYKCYGVNYALCRYGVVDAVAGGAVVDKWTAYTISELSILYKLVKKQYKVNKTANQISA